MAQAQTTIQDKDHTIQAQTEALQAMDEEIARLKALLEAKQK